MKKSILAATFLLLVIFSLMYIIHNAKVQNENLTLLNNSISKVKLINKDFDLYLIHTIKYNNFDTIEKKITSFNNNLKKIYNNPFFNKQFKNTLNELQTISKEKIIKIRKAESYRAILNNSLLIIQNLKRKISIKDYDQIYVNILTLEINPELQLQKIFEDFKQLQHHTKYEKYFLIHIKNILIYKQKLNVLNNSIQKLQLHIKLDNFHKSYQNFTNEVRQKAHLAIVILFFLLLILIIVYLIFTFKLIKSKNSLDKFTKTVQNSDNIVMTTDKEQNITYVNDAFTKTTGYNFEEVVGKTPKILQSGKQSKEFYEELNKTIYSGKMWSGQFINTNKNGQLNYEKASITPIVDEQGNIKEFIAIKLDITNEIRQNKQLQEKEKLLAQQSKMAAMGEMLENIAHQWRQPLSIISTLATGIIVNKELGKVDEEDEIKKLDDINNSVQYLSETIDDFRDFFKPNKEKDTFNLKNTYKRALKISSSKFKTLNIDVIEDLIDINIYSLENEIIQVIMNILNNAKDVLESKKEQERLIFVTSYIHDKNAILKIQDNGGGIPTQIIDKIFEPYFTTKHKSQGTGIGLYMSYEMISKHINGNLSVTNVQYTYNNIAYKGACFTIEIPLPKSI